MWRIDGNAGHIHLARVAAGVEQVVLVFLAWFDVGLGGRGARRRGRGAGPGGRQPGVTTAAVSSAPVEQLVT